MELNDNPYSETYNPLSLMERELLNESDDSFYEFTISYPENRKNYYKMIWKDLEKDGWIASNGTIIGKQIHVTFKKALYYGKS